MATRKKRHVIVVALAGALGYLLLAPFPAGRETVLVPRWQLDPGGRVASASAPGAVYGFVSGGRVGYLDEAGSLLASEPVLYGATAAGGLFINYARLPGALVVKDARGGFVAALPALGYPILDRAGDGVLLVSREANGLIELDRSGEMRWRREYPSIITALDFCEGGVLVGFLDGTLGWHDREGRLLYSIKPEGSRAPVILGCAASADAIACVAGIEPQRLVIASRREGRFRPVVDLPLSSDFRREVFVRFSKRGELLYFEEPQGIGILELGSRRVHHLRLPAQVRAVAELPDLGLWAVLYAAPKGGGPAGLLLFETAARLVARESLPATADFLEATTRGFVVGLGRKLVGVEVRLE